MRHLKYQAMRLVKARHEEPTLHPENSTLCFISVMFIFLHGLVAQAEQRADSLSKIKACELLTKKEIAEAIGAKVASVSSGEGSDLSNCLYRLIREGQDKTDFIVNVVYFPPGSASGQKELDFAKAEGKPVAGLGGEAYWHGVLDVRMGDHLLEIDVQSIVLHVGSEAAKATAIRLAQKALKRMRQVKLEQQVPAIKMDACQLLVREEVSQAIGRPVEEVNPSKDFASC